MEKVIKQIEVELSLLKESKKVNTNKIVCCSSEMVHAIVEDGKGIDGSVIGVMANDPVIFNDADEVKNYLKKLGKVYHYTGDLIQFYPFNSDTYFNSRIRTLTECLKHFSQPAPGFKIVK